MSSEVSQRNPVYRKFQTRPKLNKHKVRDFLQKGWEISSSDFHEKQLEKKKSPTFVLNNEDAISEQKNNESLKKNFFGSVCNSIKRKSVSEITNTAKDFSHFDEKSASCSILPNNYLFLSHEGQRNIFPKKRKCFDVPDFQASFLEKKSCSKLTLHGSNDFKHVFDQSHQLFEKEPRRKKPLCELSFNQKSFYSDFVKKVPVSDISINYCSNMKEPVLFTATENLKNISNAEIEMPQQEMTQLIEKEPKKNKPLRELSFNQSSFFSDFVKKVPVSEISVNFCNNMKEPVLFTAPENLTNISETKLEMSQEMAQLFKKEPKKNKPLCEISFNQSSFFSDFVKKAEVSDIPVNYCNNMKERVLFTATENLTNISDTKVKMPKQEITHECLPNVSDLQYSKKQSLFENLNLNKIASSNASLSVGSNWVQSLQWPAQENSHLDEKRKVPGILPGGYSDQMLKLQRRELSEKAFYDHKIGVKKNRDSLTMTVISFLPLDEIVVAKCFVSPTSSSSEEEVLNLETQFRKDLKNFYCKDSAAVDVNGKEDHFFAESLYLVLFRKHLFCKQQMKPGRSFLLLQPWNYFLLKSLQYPVIFCTHFKNIIMDLPLCDDILNKRCTRLKRYHDTRKCNMGLKNNINASQKYKEIDMFCYKWKTSLHLSARIQRIWKRGLLLEKSLDFPSNQNCCRLSLLLQSKDGIFFELVVPCLSDALLVDWFKCIWNGEGKCYTFYNLKVAHRLQRKRCTTLFKYLQTLLKQNTVGELNQDFIYQLVIDKVSKVPCEIMEPSFPVPLPVCIKPLVYLQRDFSDNERFSCAVKILFQYKEFLYISDESILNSATIQYVRVILSKEESFLFGSEIIIKEAVIQEGNLMLDQYSQISTSQEKDDKLAVVSLEDLKMPLHINSRLSDLVVVTGEIISVDDNEAYTWLQCSFCFKENLVQDTEGTIYCEDCSVVVEKPVLNVKMSVTIISQEESNIPLNIQLLSCTIKKILSLDENSYHPHCSVSDVLGKQVGPLLCYVRGDEMMSSKKVFYLTEINPH